VTKRRDRQGGDAQSATRPGGSRESREDRARRQNELLDEGLDETFPASDPVSVVRLK